MINNKYLCYIFITVLFCGTCRASTLVEEWKVDVDDFYREKRHVKFNSLVYEFKKIVSNLESTRKLTVKISDSKILSKKVLDIIQKECNEVGVPSTFLINLSFVYLDSLGIDYEQLMVMTRLSEGAMPFLISNLFLGKTYSAEELRQIDIFNARLSDPKIEKINKNFFKTDSQKKGGSTPVKAINR